MSTDSVSSSQCTCDPCNCNPCLCGKNSEVPAPTEPQISAESQQSDAPQVSDVSQTTSGNQDLPQGVTCTNGVCYLNTCTLGTTECNVTLSDTKSEICLSSQSGDKLDCSENKLCTETCSFTKPVPIVPSSETPSGLGGIFTVKLNPYLPKTPIVPVSYKHPSHTHSLLLGLGTSSVFCDNSNCRTETARDMYIFSCPDCDFDLCETCFQFDCSDETRAIQVDSVYRPVYSLAEKLRVVPFPDRVDGGCKKCPPLPNNP